MNDPEDPTHAKIKWYIRPVAVIIAILLIGPFALPFLWTSPAFKRNHKIIITLLVFILSLWLIESLVRLYTVLLNEIQRIQDISNLQM